MTEQERLRKLSDHVWNLLGLRDPDEVAAWINGARAELAEARRKELGEADPDAWKNS